MIRSALLRTVPVRRARSALWRCIVGALLLLTVSSREAVAAGITLAWDPNTTPDVIGYLVSYGTSSTALSYTVDVGAQTSYDFAAPDPTAVYYLAVRAYNNFGVTSPYSNIVQWTPPTPTLTPPSVTTGVASSMTTNGATLNGTANANGIATIAYFQYGSTVSYGATTTAVSLGQGTGPLPIGNGNIVGLTCNTVYHFRAVASSSVDTMLGSDASFTTAACALPQVTTGSALSVGSTAATLTATIDGGATPTTGFFQYGLTTNYGYTTTQASLASGVGSIATNVSGLTCGALYHFRGTATNASGTSSGGDATFTTAACGQGPVIVSQPKSQTISAGQTAAVSVQATGTEPFSYQWYVGNSGNPSQPIAGAVSNVYMTVALESSLSVWVRISNAYGTADSKTATIKISPRHKH